MELRSRKILISSPVVERKKKDSRTSCNRLYEWKPSKDNVGLQFFRESTLHGFKYLGSLSTHLCERVFWAIALLFFLGVSFMSIVNVFDKYLNNPIIVSYQPFEISLEQIPFPAITICNVNNLQNSVVEEIINFYRASPEGSKNQTEAKNMLEFVIYVCQMFSSSFSTIFNYSVFNLPVKDSAFYENFNDTTLLSHFSPESIEMILKLSLPCNKLILLCSWAEEEKPCDEMFRPIETDFGMCCTFNLVPPETILARQNTAETNVVDNATKETFSNRWKDWNIDTDLVLDPNSNRIHQEVPQRQRKAGRNAALSILVDPDLKNYFCAPMDSTGFKLIAGSPVDWPSLADFGTIISPNSETFVDIRPELTMADKNIYNLDIETRNCYFTGEYKLRFFNFYTIGNCRKECKAELTITNCGCVLDYQPRNESIKLCGSSSNKCLNDLHLSVLKKGLKKHCKHCLPGCTQIQYQYTTSELRMNPSLNPWVKNGTKEPWADNHVSIIHIYFGSDSIYSRIRQRIYDTSSLLANAGGLLGLYLGFSFVSLLEIVYHFIIKLIFERNDDGEYVVLQKWRNRKNNNVQNISKNDKGELNDETLKAIFVKSQMGKIHEKNKYPWSTGEIVF